MSQTNHDSTSLSFLTDAMASNSSEIVTPNTHSNVSTNHASDIIHVRVKNKLVSPTPEWKSTYCPSTHPDMKGVVVCKVCHKELKVAKSVSGLSRHLETHKT